MYDLNGALKFSANATSSSSYIYDGFGRVTEIKYDNGVKKAYTYDSGDRVTNYAINIGSVEEYKVKYEYDVGGRKTAVVYNGLRSTYAYNAANQLTSEANGLTGAVTTYKYTTTGAAKTIDTKLGTELVNHYEYKYDLVGNETEKVENGKTTTYTYDALSRLVTASLADVTTQNYEYDDYGNISSLTEIKGSNISESLYYYDNAGRLTLKSCEKDGTQSRFEYDACGNLVHREDVTTKNGGSASDEASYTFNGYNQLVRAVNAYGETYEYTYDTEGLRNGKSSADETTRYICESGNIVLETDGIGKVTAKNVWGMRLLMRETNDQTYSYFFNGHGDITALTEEHGYVLEDYDYDPYGNELTEDTKVGAGYSWQASQVTYYDNPFRYCGEYYDAETGFYYLRARYYSPDIQRFISEDTYIGVATDPMSLNLYAYCQGDPINNTDPSGHIKIPTWAKIAIGTVGIAAAVAITVATGGAAAPALIAVAKVVAVSVVTSAAISAGTAAVSSRVQTGNWKGAGAAALKGAKEGAIDGYMLGGVGAAASATAKAVQVVNATKNVANAAKTAESICFTADTFIPTIDGYKEISDIKVGDEVYSENPATGEKGLKTVKNVFVHETNVLIHVFVGQEEIKVTPTHPFWVEGIGWVAAGELEAGDKVSLYNGNDEAVDKTTVEILNEPIKVYNFEVENWHTYFVSKSQVLVHNSCAQNFKKASVNDLEKIVSESFHGPGGAKQAILKDISKDVLKKVGKNPDIYLNKEGTIQVVSTIKKGISFITNLNIKSY